MERSLLLPPPRIEPHWALTQRHTTFLDMTIMLPIQHWEAYKMVFFGAETPVALQKKASAVTLSADGREYVRARTAQLSEHFFGGEQKLMKFGTSPDIVGYGKTEQVVEVKEMAPEKTVDEILADMIPKAARDLQNILKNPSDPNYNDAFRVVLQKLIRDLNTEKGARPPERYLPEVPCNSCRYKLFVEENTIDECARCKYRKFGISKGLIYDHKTQLENDKD